MYVYDGKCIEHFEVTEEHWKEHSWLPWERRNDSWGAKDAEGRFFF